MPHLWGEKCGPGCSSSGERTRSSADASPLACGSGSGAGAGAAAAATGARDVARFICCTSWSGIESSVCTRADADIVRSAARRVLGSGTVVMTCIAA